MTEPITLSQAELQTELEAYRLMHQVHSRLSAILEVEALDYELVRLIHEIVPIERCLLFVMDKEGHQLEYGAAFPKLKDRTQQTALEMLLINTFTPTPDHILQSLKERRAISATPTELATSRLKEFNELLQAQVLCLPVLNVEEWLGVLFIVPHPDQAIAVEKQHLLKACLEAAANHLYNARQHSQTTQELANTVHEMTILQQVDAELNDTIELSFVFNLILDWALRFTTADTAVLAMYDYETDTLRISHYYGNDITRIETNVPIDHNQGGIMLRVARSGKSEVIPDVLMDKDYYALSRTTRSQIAVPITREEHVIGVLTLDSRKLNGFTENHLTFVQKLASRAGVAVDNARLFSETRREKEKLALILRNITDGVIVTENDGQIILLNRSAAWALRLEENQQYTGRNLREVLLDSPLLDFFKQSQTSNETTLEGEFKLPNELTYRAFLSRHKEIGWILVMQDITYFKETDRVKNELLSTVSHDLKQPLAVMRGYLDLLQMTNTFDERSTRYMESLDYAFYGMRQLIDDLLDMARIEAGIKMDTKPIQLRNLLGRCVDLVNVPAHAKLLKLKLELADDLPPIQGDEQRVEQIFNNLIGNAIKYTRPEGNVKVYSETTESSVIIHVQDNGLGIAPEDQKRIFERFYRVRRSETESIEGTGLGLAIVKSLVEAHHGTIVLTSKLNEGSTFTVTFPRQPAPTN